MRLVSGEYNIDITFRENEINVLSIENRAAFSEIAQDLWQQSNGYDGAFVLSEQDKVLKFESVCRCIFNPFALDCNEKKIINKVYSEIGEAAAEMLPLEFAKVNKDNFEFIEKLLTTIPYALVSDFEISVVDFLKLYGVRFAADYENVAERIIEYMRISHMVLGIRLFIYYNLKQYLTDEQISSLYEFAVYEKVQLLIVEGEKTKQLAKERHCIVDNDLCIIDVNPYE